MSLGANKQALMGAAGAAGGGDFYTHQIANSCRFNASANAHMYHTQGTPTNVDKCTISLWVKRGKLGAAMYAFTGSGTSGAYSHLSFGGDGNDPDLFYYLQNPGSVTVRLESTALFRDPNAWMHLVIANDSTQGSAADRNKLYINGTLYTDYGSYTDYSTANSDFLMNTSGHKLFVGSGGDSAGAVYLPYDGYIAEYVFIDGTQYAATDFGETKNGAWIPKDPSGLTFGNNGAYLKFESSGDLGNDSSGNNNDFTLSNVSTHDQMLDSPTFGSSSSGNFATIGGLEKNTGGFTFSEGNLKYAVSTNQRGFIASQGVPESGKYYWEVRVTAFGGSQDDVLPGVCVPDLMRSNLTGSRGGANVSGAGGYTVNLYNGAFVLNGVYQSNDSIGNKRAVPQTVGIAIDRDNNTFKWTYDGSTYSSTYAIPSSGVLAPFLGSGGGSNTASGVFNFGADSTFAGLISAGGNADENGFGDFSLAVPTGYLALCAGNLPVADAINPSETNDNYPQKLFNPLLYTGDGGSSTAITGLGFQPDWVWIKRRNAAENNNLYDSSRGVNKRIKSNSDGAETTEGLPAFGSDGFTVDASGGINNVSSQTYVAWNWRANGGTETTNNVGTQTSYTQTDPSGGFSIVRYAGTGSSMTVGHGLSVEPKLTIIKDRGATVDWVVYTKLVDGSLDFFILNTDTASADSGFTGPNSTIWNFDGSSSYSNTAGRNYIMYNFANIEGYCKVGTYVGNADDNGTFLYTGFKPAFFMCKPIVTGNWRIQDNKRTPFNVADKTLFPNRNDGTLSNSSNEIDIVSNGVKMRASDSDYNQATTFVYLAMAENPFKFAVAR